MVESDKGLPCMKSISHQRYSRRWGRNNSSSIWHIRYIQRSNPNAMCSLRYRQVPSRRAKCNQRAENKSYQPHPFSLSTIQSAQIKSLFTNSACSVFPSDAGLRSTITPAASSAAILESAPPLPPLTMAPIQ